MQPDLKSGPLKSFPPGLNFPAHDGIPISKSGVVSLEAGAAPSDVSVEEQYLAKKIPLEQVFQHHPLEHHHVPSPIVWRFVLLAGDLVLFLALLAIAFGLAQHVPLKFDDPTYGVGMWNARLTWAFLALFSWSIAINLTHAQELAYVSNRFASPLRMGFALTGMLVCWIALSWLFFGVDLAALLKIDLIFFVLAVPLFCSWRIALFTCMHLPRFRSQTVIIGVNASGESIAKVVQQVKHSDLRIIGFINERINGEIPSRSLPVLGGRSGLRYLVKNHLIDSIIMAFDTRTNPDLFQEAIDAAQHGIAVLPISIVYERLTGKIPVEHIGDQWYLELPSERKTTPFYVYWRKLMDIIFGLIGLLALLALLPLLALLITLDSPGPIFYSQERVGCQGKPFRILKFRSMRTDAERIQQPQWASAEDARVTRIGRFMRATHLDELPQALNILRGDMSLIGPRPERPTFVEELEKTLPFYSFRLSIKPGLTGWAQVKYPYASSTEDTLHKLQYDLFYIKHQSFTLDMFIILKTFVEVVLSRGR
jgi:exopolysaccharide biosynthesis polyprenyl glycosylphosphotransferase